jgi:hypothetical protein
MDSTKSQSAARRAILEEAGIASDTELLVARCLLTYETDRLPPEERIAWDALEPWKQATWIIEARDLIERA